VLRFRNRVKAGLRWGRLTSEHTLVWAYRRRCGLPIHETEETKKSAGKLWERTRSENEYGLTAEIAENADKPVRSAGMQPKPERIRLTAKCAKSAKENAINTTKGEIERIVDLRVNAMLKSHDPRATLQTRRRA
jgi:hypothetical protein